MVRRCRARWTHTPRSGRGSRGKCCPRCGRCSAAVAPGASCLRGSSRPCRWRPGWHCRRRPGSSCIGATERWPGGD
ncbi:MAG TPA: hypothetical protein DGT21_21530 [Armatimonadetes bacterium]|nr:hypothetical protein [Armatimonadota bacterium]